MGFFERKPDDSRCAFCSEPRQKCRSLVAGPRVSICDRCALLAAAVTNDDATVLSTLLADDTAAKSPEVRWALTQALAQCGDGSGYPVAVDALAATEDERCVRLLLSRTGRNRWRPNDWATFSWASAGLEEFESAADAARAGLEFTGSDQQLSYILWNNRIWSECHLKTPPSLDVLDAHHEKMHEVQDFWRTKTDSNVEHADRFLSFAHGTMAKVLEMKGELAEALSQLQAAADTSAGAQPRTLVLWGDILAGRGEIDLAVRKWRAARKKAHPDPGSPLEAALRSRLNKEAPSSNG